MPQPATDAAKLALHVGLWQPSCLGGPMLTLLASIAAGVWPPLRAAPNIVASQRWPHTCSIEGKPYSNLSTPSRWWAVAALHAAPAWPRPAGIGVCRTGTKLLLADQQGSESVAGQAAKSASCTTGRNWAGRTCSLKLPSHSRSCPPFRRTHLLHRGFNTCM